MRPPAPRALVGPTSTGSILRLVSAMAEEAVDRLFPWRCLGCERDAREPVCPGCLEAVATSAEAACVRCGIPFASGPERPCGRCLARPPTFARARAIVAYVASSEGDDPVGRAIRAFKYGKRRGVGRFLARRLAERTPYRADEHDVIVPVPLEIGRLRARGFNQTLVLARPLARRSGTALAPRALARIRATPSQVDLDERARRANLAGAIVVREPAAVRERRILLVDDVITTGATANACARALVDAGAASVDVLAVARAPLR